MTAKELRLQHGNIVWLTIPNEGRKIVQFNRDLEYLDFEPVELKNNWLHHLGFSDKDYKKGFTGISKGLETDFIIMKPFYMGEFQNFYAYQLYGSGFKRLDYVHQLQNLFSAIKETDLIFGK